MKTIIVWHFAGSTLRDGSPLPEPGYVAPEIVGPIPCKRGYHGSRNILDALSYAPGTFLCQRELSGVIVPHGDPVDKYCASRFTQLTPYTDVQDMLVRFARHAALLALRVDAPLALRSAGLHDYANRLAALSDDCDMDAAQSAAWGAADAARRAAQSAARGAADAARRAAWGAADAARGAALDAAQSAARRATWGAARGAADAAQSAAQSARRRELESWLLRSL